MRHCEVVGEVFIKWQNFRLVQIECIYIRQNKRNSKIQIWFWNGRKQRKEGNASHRACNQQFLLLPQYFQ